MITWLPCTVNVGEEGFINETTSKKTSKIASLLIFLQRLLHPPTHPRRTLTLTRVQLVFAGVLRPNTKIRKKIKTNNQRTSRGKQQNKAEKNRRQPRRQTVPTWVVRKMSWPQGRNSWSSAQTSSGFNSNSNGSSGQRGMGIRGKGKRGGGVVVRWKIVVRTARAQNFLFFVHRW